MERRLANATVALVSTRHALEDFRTPSRPLLRRETDFANFVIHARRVMAMLERLRNENGYREWTALLEDELKNNQLWLFFDSLRGTLEHGSSIKIPWRFTFTTPEDSSGAVHIALDPQTGSLRLSDPGTGVVAAPTSDVILTAEDDRLPEHFRVIPMDELMGRHIAVLESVVRSAFARFRSPSTSPLDSA